MSVPPPLGLPVRVSWAVALLAAVLVLGIHLYLVRYAYPATDDWQFAASGRDQGVGPAVLDYLNTSGGRWASVSAYYALGWLPDLATWYPALVAATQALLLGGVWLLLARVPLGGARRWGLTVVTAAVLVTALPVLTVGNLAWHSATPETLYGLSGAWVYSLALPVIALALWLVLDPARDARRLRWWPALVGLLGVLASGLSEIAGVAAALVGLVAGLAGRRLGWVLFAAAVAGFGLAAMSPGNRARADLLQAQVTGGSTLDRVAPALLSDLWFTLRHLRDWAVQPAVLGALLAAAGLGAATAGDAGDRRARRRGALVLAAAVPLTIYAMALPTLAFVTFLEARHEGLLTLVVLPLALAAAFAVGHAWPVGPTGWWRWAAAAAGAGLCLAGPWLARLDLPAWSAWMVWPGLALAVAALVLWARGGRLATCAAPLLIAAGLLLSPGHWHAWDDLPTAAALRAKQAARDQQVRELVAQGHQLLILPYLGQFERLPRTIALFELQPGWMVDGYARYHHLAKALLSERYDNVRYPRPSPATPPVAPPAPTETPAPPVEPSSVPGEAGAAPPAP